MATRNSSKYIYIGKYNGEGTVARPRMMTGIKYTPSPQYKRYFLSYCYQNTQRTTLSFTVITRRGPFRASPSGDSSTEIRHVRRPDAARSTNSAAGVLVYNNI